MIGLALTKAKLNIKELAAQYRKNDFLNLAEELIYKSNFKEFQLEDLAAPSGFSRGSIYSIFKTKDILIAMMAINAVEEMYNMVERSSNFKGSSRERLLAFHISQVLFMHIHPVAYHSIYTSGLMTDRSKLPENLLLEFDAGISRLVNILHHLIEEAVHCKELTLPDYFSPAEYAENIWNGQYGTLATALNHKGDMSFYINKYKKFMRVVADSLPWHPTSSEVDYDVVTKRIIGEIFSNEYMAVKKANPSFI